MRDMPRKGYKTITITENYFDRAKKIAKLRKQTLPKLVESMIEEKEKE